MNFRDMIHDDTNDIELASVVGCGIDRLEESQREQMSIPRVNHVIDYYRDSKSAIDSIETINAKREAIKNYCLKQFFR